MVSVWLCSNFDGLKGILCFRESTFFPMRDDPTWEAKITLTDLLLFKSMHTVIFIWRYFFFSVVTVQPLKNENASAGAIIGGVLAAVVAIVIAIVILIVVYRKGNYCFIVSRVVEIRLIVLELFLICCMHMKNNLGGNQ